MVNYKFVLMLILVASCVFALKTERIQPTADALIYARYPNTNYGDRQYLTLRYSSSLFQSRSLLKFDTSKYAGANITSAKLYLFMYYSSADDSSFAQLRRITSDWSELSVTWNTQPTYSTEIYNQTLITNYIWWYEWDATEMVREWANGTYPNYGMELMFPTFPTVRTKWFYSREATNLQPYLEITYEYYTLMDFWTDKTIYNQWDGIKNETVYLFVNYTNTTGLPIPNAICYVRDNVSNIETYLTYNSTTGLYEGSISANYLHGNVSLYAMCGGVPEFSENYTSKSIGVHMMFYLHEPEKLNLTKPTTNAVVNKTSTDNVLGWATVFSANTTEFNRPYNIRGTTTIKINMSTNDTYTDYRLRLSIIDENNNTVNVYYTPTFKASQIPTVYELNITRDYTILSNYKLGLSLQAYNATGAIINTSVYYNYSYEEPSIILWDAIPIKVISKIISTKQIENEYVIGPNQTMDASFKSIIELNNTQSYPDYIADFHFVPSTIVYYYHNSISSATVRNSTGGVIPSTIEPDNHIVWDTETVPPNSVLNETVVFVVSDAINNTESLEFEGSIPPRYYKSWKIDITDKLTSLNNVTVYTNYTYYGIDPEWYIRVILSNSSGSFDVSDRVTISGDLLIMPTINLSSATFDIDAFYYICGEYNEDAVLNKDIYAQGTCINITSNNVTIDCAGHRIIGNGSGVGIISTYNDTKIKNCIIENFTIGIEFDGSVNDTYNNLVENTTIFNSSQYAIYNYHSHNSIFNNLTIYNNFQTGINVFESYNVNVTNVYGRNTSIDGVVFYYSSSGHVENITAEYKYGLYCSVSNITGYNVVVDNMTLINSIANINNSYVSGILNIVSTNITSVDLTFNNITSSGNSNYTAYYTFDITVVDVNSNPVSSALINITNSYGVLVISNLTDSNGNLKGLLLSLNISNDNYTYLTPHEIVAYHTGYPSHIQTDNIMSKLIKQIVLQNFCEADLCAVPNSLNLPMDNYETYNTIISIISGDNPVNGVTCMPGGEIYDWITINPLYLGDFPPRSEKQLTVFVTAKTNSYGIFYGYIQCADTNGVRIPITVSIANPNIPSSGGGGGGGACIKECPEGYKLDTTKCKCIEVEKCNISVDKEHVYSLPDTIIIENIGNSTCYIKMSIDTAAYKLSTYKLELKAGEEGIVKITETEYRKPAVANITIVYDDTEKIVKIHYSEKEFRITQDMVIGAAAVVVVLILIYLLL